MGQGFCGYISCQALIPPWWAPSLGSRAVGERMASHHMLQHSWKQRRDDAHPALLDVSSTGREVLLGNAGKRYQTHLQGAQGGTLREEGCRERFSGMGMRVRAITQARAEALGLPCASNPNPRGRKLLPFLPSYLIHGLQKAYMKKHGVVIFFVNCCMHARNRL